MIIDFTNSPEFMSERADQRIACCTWKRGDGFDEGA